VSERDRWPTRLRDPKAWAGVLAVCSAGTLLLVWLGHAMGIGSPIFAFEFHFVGMAGAVYVDRLLVPRLESARFVVSPGEARVYRALGAHAFLRLQRAIGWEALLRRGQHFELQRSTLHVYDRATRQGENAHALLFLLTLAVALAAALAGSAAAARWLVGMGVIFHVYPVMLQRMQRARLQPLLARLRRSPSESAGDRT
jgi:hypothetical protein